MMSDNLHHFGDQSRPGYALCGIPLEPSLVFRTAPPTICPSCDEKWVQEKARRESRRR